MKHKNLPIRFAENEHKDLKLFCVGKGLSMQEFVTRAIQEYMKRWGA